MALIALPYLASYTFRDNNAKESTSQVLIQAAAAPAAAVAAAGNVATALSALSNAVLVRYSVARVFEEAEPATPPAESEVERKLVMVFKANNRQTVIVTVPSPIFGLELPGTNVINYDNATFATVRSLLLAGVDGTPFVSNAGSVLASFNQAYISHRYRRP